MQVLQAKAVNERYPGMCMELSVEGDESCISLSGKLLCFWQAKKIMQLIHGNFPYMFDCWADPVFHLLLKSSMV